MQSRSNCPRSTGGTDRFAGQLLTQAAATANFAMSAADAVEFSWSKTRYRSPYRLSANPVRVLIVANLTQCMAIAALIHSIGRFATRMSCSAETALKLGREFQPDIVLLATDLPELASYRLAAALRWGSGRPFPRLIAITDDVLPGDRNCALAAGFEQYLILPVQRAALESVLRPGRAGRLLHSRSARKPGN
jgi:CheY-like chemotaxis protein